MDVVVTAHLARRGFHAVRQSLPDGETLTDLQADFVEAIERFKSPVSITVLVATFIVFFLVDFIIEYPIRFVIGNLAAIEDVRNDCSKEFELDGLLDQDEPPCEVHGGKLEYEEDQISVDEDAETGQVRQKLLAAKKGLEDGGVPSQRLPITKNLWTALRHLHSLGGVRSFFRGLRAHVVMSIILFGITIALDYAIAIHPRVVDDAISISIGLLALFTSMFVLTPVHTAWTHATIRANPQTTARNGLHSSPPHTVGWRRYIPGVWSTKTILPMLRYFIFLALFLEGTEVIGKEVMRGLPHDSIHPAISTALAIVASLLFAVPIGLLVVLPAYIALLRVQASLLPESDQAVVPFDRSFGGRSTNWGHGEMSWWRYIWVNLGPLGAWKAFDREAYFRVLAVFVKVFFILLVYVGVFFGVMELEIRVILGDKIRMLPYIIIAMNGE